MKSFGMVYNVLYNAILFLPLLILFDKLNLVSSDFKESKKDFRTHFNVILSVARLYEVKTIILVQFNYSGRPGQSDLINYNMLINYQCFRSSLYSGFNKICLLLLFCNR